MFSVYNTAVFFAKNVAKKGKKKKTKRHHPYLVSGGIVLILLSLAILIWLFGGRSLFIETPAVAKNFSNAKALYEADLNHMKDAKAAEDRIKALVGKSENKDIVITLTDSLNSHAQAVEEHNTELNLTVIALEQMSVPFDMLWAKNRLENGTEKITQWKTDAKSYYEIASLYYKLITGIVEYKDQVASQNFDKQNNDQAMISHSVMKDICDKILLSTSALSEDQKLDLPNTATYFTKAKTYHEKSIAFYQADKSNDMTTEKALVTEISTLKDELAKLDPVLDLTNFEASYLNASRATLDDEEQAIEHEFISFRNK